MNSFLLLIILLLNLIFTISQNHFKIRYDSCDIRWANETLWSNNISNTNSTICNDVELIGKKLPKGFVTLIADAFANRNITCGGENNQICNPSILNKFLEKCMIHINSKSKDATIYKCIGLKQYEKTMKINEIDDYVFDGYTLLAAENKNTFNRFMIEGVYDEFYIKALDYRGNSLILHYEDLTEIAVFKILKPKKNKKGKKKGKNENTIDINIDL